MKMKTQSYTIILAAAGLLTASLSGVHATDFTWTGATSGDWGNSTNWDSEPTFDADHGIIFYQTGAGNLATFISDNRTIGSITFNANATSNVGVRLTTTSGGSTGRTLTLGSATVAPTITVASGASGDFTIGNSGHGAIALANNLTVTHNGSGTLTLGRGITKEGSGTLVVGTNGGTGSYSGGTQVDGGTLRVQGTGIFPIGTGAVTVSGSGSILDLDRNDTFRSHTISDQDLTINSGGLVTNGTQINRGFNALKTLSLDGGELRVTGTARSNADGDLFRFEAYVIRDTVTVTGTVASSITNPGGIANAGINIGGFTNLGGNVGSSLTFDVANVTGDSAADLSVSAVLKDNYTSSPFTRLANGLVKTGAGTMVLSATNRYTGATEINAGTLLINGSTTTDSAVTVASGATLGGSGTVGGAITVESGGTIAPGGGSGTLTTSRTVTLEPGAVFAAQIDSAATTAGQIFAFDDITLTGAILSLSDIAATPASILAGTKLTLIDYDTLTLTGIFDGLPEGSTVAAGINSFTLSYADGGAVTLTAFESSDPFAMWAAGAGLDGSPGKEAGFDDDPDGDGVANGLEWVLGGNPLDGQSGSLVTTTATVADGLTLNFTRKEDSIGVATLVVEYNTDLGAAWNQFTIGATSSSEANGVTITIDTDATPDQVTVNIPASNAPDGKLFARLKATK